VSTLMFKLFLFLALTAFTTAHAASVSDQIRQPVKKAIDTYQHTQLREEHWREEKQRLTDRYEELLKTHGALVKQKKILDDQNAAAKKRIAAKETDIERMEQITAQISPFLNDLTGRLEKMTATDAPFLANERRLRLAKLQGLLKDPEISESEKFRKAAEALFVEAEYGQTIEVYQETLAIEGEALLVNILRLGRLALFYQNLDQTSCGRYDVFQKRWRKLPGKYNHAIAAAMEMGAQKRPVDLLTLPIGRIERQ